MKPTIIFFGTPSFAVPVLTNLINNFNVLAVITQPDKPVGRKRVLTPSPIKELALKNKIPVYMPVKVIEVTSEISQLNPDFLVSCAYGQIIPKDILDIPKYYPLNVHASLLPLYRGAAPIQRAIMDGQEISGISIMEMEEGLDTGGVFKIESIPIIDDNYQVVSDKLAYLGSKLIVQVINEIINNNLQPVSQDDKQATYAHKLTHQDEVLDFTKDTITLYNQIKALTPNPGALIIELNMKVLSASPNLIKTNYPVLTIFDITKESFKIATIDGSLIIKRLQIIGKKPISALEYYNQCQNTSQK